MTDTTLEAAISILVGIAEGNSSASLFFFSISVTLACLNVYNKLLFSQEFANNLVKRFLAICEIIYSPGLHPLVLKLYCLEISYDYSVTKCSVKSTSYYFFFFFQLWVCFVGAF